MSLKAAMVAYDGVDERRTRWFGATGKRVPQIALADEIALDEALVIDYPDAPPELLDAVLKQAHARGQPVCVYADTPAAVLAALRRPEVSCVIVAAELLDLDLIALTYGP